MQNDIKTKINKTKYQKYLHFTLQYDYICKVKRENCKNKGIKQDNVI